MKIGHDEFEIHDEWSQALTSGSDLLQMSGRNLLMRYAELKVPTFLKVEVALAVISPAI